MKLRIQAYLISAFIIASGAPLVVFWFWPYSGILEDKKAEVRERHLLIAKNLGSAMETYHRDIVSVLDAFSSKIASGEAVEAKPIFDNLYFRHVCVADAATGAVLDDYFTEEHPCPDVVPPKRMAMFVDLAAGNDVGMSGVLAPPNGKPRLFLVKRVGSKLIIGAIHTGFFRNMQKRISFGRNGHAAIMDQTGRVLAHPRSDWETSAADLSTISVVERMIRGESGVETFYSPAMKADMIAGFASVKGAGWGVMVPQPLSELQDVAERFNRDAILILSIGLTLSLLLALIVSLQVSRRVDHIATAVRSVAEECDNVRVQPSHDVIGIHELLSLESAINQMAEESTTARAARRTQNRELRETNERLRTEMDKRMTAQAGREDSERHFQSLFGNVPIPIRIEDLSGMKRLVDDLNIKDPDAFTAYLDENPEFLERCGQTINVVDVNKAALTLHGYRSKTEMIDRVVKHLSPAALEIVRRGVIAIHAGATSDSYETDIRCADGTMRTVSATWSVISGYEDSFSRSLLASVDITERLKSEDALRQAQKMEAVGQLTGGVAHDFNNLLTVIGGNTELLSIERDADPSLTDPIRNAVRRGAELTQRLLAFSRKQPLTPKTINLVDLVEGMSELLRRTLGDEVTVEINSQSDLWQAIADPGQVETALLNLALNSRDAMPRGGTLRLECENKIVTDDDNPELMPGDYVVLAISDTGTGMTEEVVERAVEPFFTTKEVGKGSGLGLSMVYGFAKQSNGDLRIQSSPDDGTTVRLYLPRSTLASSSIDQENEPGRSVHGKGQSILVLEDDPEVRTYLTRLVDSLGYRGIPAQDARAARKVLDQTQQIDLLLSDVMLPGGISGPMFAEEVSERLPGVSVIFVSGHPWDANLNRIDGLRRAPVLTKPFNAKLLADTIQDFLHAD